jgi:hypothetical protein
MDEHAKLSLADLSVGDHYIGFPLPGDNSGHGGYLGTSHVFQKITINSSRRLFDGVVSEHNQHSGQMKVLRVTVFAAPQDVNVENLVGLRVYRAGSAPGVVIKDLGLGLDEGNDSNQQVRKVLVRHLDGAERVHSMANLHPFDLMLERERVNLYRQFWQLGELRRLEFGPARLGAEAETGAAPEPAAG